MSYYEVLGLERDASQDDIKRVYKELAFKYHPDRNPDNREESEKIFKKIIEAYKVLSDENSRKQYDMFGGDNNNIQELIINFFRNNDELMNIFNEKNFKTKLLIFLMRKVASYLEN